MNQYNNIGIRWMMPILFITILAACSKMDGTYKEFLKGGEIRYGKRPDSVGVYPGNNRAQVWFVSSSANRLSRAVVYWNDRADSITIPISTQLLTDTIRAVIDDIAEGSYTFEFVAYDNEDNYSLPKDTIAEVYGEVYRASLSPRVIRNAWLANGTIRVFWYDVSNPQTIGTEIRYKDQNETEMTVTITADDDQTRISEVPLGDSIQIRSLFKPHPKSIDTFYSDYQTVYLEEVQPGELDKSLFAEYRLPTDAELSTRWSAGMHLMWDGNIGGSGYYRTNDGSGSPHWFTFDLGIHASLSRLLVWQRSVGEENLLFNNANIRLFEVWGSDDPDPNGSWDSWTKLMDCESQKPSGLPIGQLGEADLKQAQDGEVFTFPANIPSVRYLRIKAIETWNPGLSDRLFISELSLYGIPE